jgi:hypothetical protein
MLFAARPVASRGCCCRDRLKEVLEEVAYKKILACTNKALVTDLGRYLYEYKGKCKWFNKLKDFQTINVLN